MVFREELRRALGGQEVLPDDWTTTAAELLTGTLNETLSERTPEEVYWCQFLRTRETCRVVVTMEE